MNFYVTDFPNPIVSVGRLLAQNYTMLIAAFRFREKCFRAVSQAPAQDSVCAEQHFKQTGGTKQTCSGAEDLHSRRSGQWKEVVENWVTSDGAHACAGLLLERKDGVQTYDSSDPAPVDATASEEVTSDSAGPGGQEAPQTSLSAERASVSRAPVATESFRPETSLYPKGSAGNTVARVCGPSTERLHPTAFGSFGCHRCWSVGMCPLDQQNYTIRS